MLQGARAAQPSGIVYNTSMSRPDAALALSAMYAFANKREARIGSVCVAGAGLDTAIFCDIVARFYTGAPRSGNDMLAVGLALASPMPADSPIVKAALDRKKDNGEPQYARSIAKVSDTSLAESVLRNGVIFSAESVVVLSAPATWLARSLDIAGTHDVYKQRVKRLVIVEAGSAPGVGTDAASLRRVAAEWPGPVFLLGREAGNALTLPAARFDAAFAAGANHPVADACRAYKAMPYDIPLYDLAAMHYAVHPESAFLQASEPGVIEIASDGSVRFLPGKGIVRNLSVDPGKRDEAIESLISLASTPPPAASGRR